MIPRRRRAMDTTSEFEGPERRSAVKVDWRMALRRLKFGEVLAALAFVAIVLKFVGAKFITSGDGIEAVQSQVTVVKHSVDSVGARVSNMEQRLDEAGRDAKTSVYLSCEVLKAVTKNAVLPTECR